MKTSEVEHWGRRIATYLWATLMPVALERANSHVGSRGSGFRHGALLGDCPVHHIWRMANEKLEIVPK